MTNPTDLKNPATGLAALSICESLMLALGDSNIISHDAAVGVISDAAAAHRGQGSTPEEAALHAAVTEILDKIISGGNSVRR